MPLPLNPLEWGALAYLALLWVGYDRYARSRARREDKSSLSRSLRKNREAWAHRLLARDMRMTDAGLLASQERVVGFFASTTLRAHWAQTWTRGSTTCSSKRPSFHGRTTSHFGPVKFDLCGHLCYGPIVILRCCCFGRYS